MRGWVYFTRLAAHSPIKIGHAFDVRSRLGALSVGSPFEFVLLGAHLSENAKADEKRLKAKLAAHRIKGEWFQAEPVLAEMQTLAIVAPEHVFKIDSPHDSRKSRLEFRVTRDEARAWQAAAEKENTSVSEWIRLRGNAGARGALT